MVDDFVGADAQVVGQLLEEAAHLTFIDMTETADEIVLHHQDALSDVLHVLGGDVGVLTCGQQFDHKIFAYKVDFFLQSSSLCHNSITFNCFIDSS